MDTQDLCCAITRKIKMFPRSPELTCLIGSQIHCVPPSRDKEVY